MIIKIDGDVATVKLKPGKACYLYSMGDVGFGGNRHCALSFDEDLAYLAAKKQEGHTIRIFSTGDNTAGTSPSERDAIISAKGGSGYYKDTLQDLDNFMADRCQKFAYKLEPFRKDFLFLETGHHYHQFSKWSEWYGLNSDQYICKLLKCQYGGKVAYFDMDFPLQKMSFRFVAAHMNGGGRTPGSGLNNRYRVHDAFRDADFVYGGHDNQAAAAVTGGFVKTVSGKPILTERRTVCIGSHEIAYKEGANADDYVEEGLMRPTPVGNVITMFEEFRGKIRPRCMI